MKRINLKKNEGTVAIWCGGVVDAQFRENERDIAI